MNDKINDIVKDLDSQLNEVDEHLLVEGVEVLPLVVPTTETGPHNAGSKNMTKEIIESLQIDDPDSDSTIGASCVMFRKGVLAKKKRQANWKVSDLIEEIQSYFDFCAEFTMKANRYGLAVWLGTCNQKISAWVNGKGVSEEIQSVMQMACDIMANECIARGEKYPTFNMFMLRASHNMSDKHEISITQKNEVTTEDIDEVIAKMGLDK